MAKRVFKDYFSYKPISLAIFIVCWLLAALASWLLPLRWYIGGSLVALIISAVFSVRFIAGSEEKDSPLPAMIAFFVGIISLVSFIYKGFTYAFAGEAFLPFWEVSLILGVLLAVFVIVKWCRKGAKAGGIIGGILGLSVVFFILVLILASHLNFLLDFKEPTEYVARIEEKDIDRNRKGPDDYRFQVTADGETFFLEVGFFEYEKYEIGDTYTFKKYEGAFGVPFYVSD